MYYCLKMQRGKRGITKCQREHDWVKLNQILHSGKFEEQVCYTQSLSSFVRFKPQIMYEFRFLQGSFKKSPFD